LPPFLSIIVPAHNEEERLKNSLERILSFLDQQSYESELIVVENGSTDRTAQIAAELAKKTPILQVHSLAGRGKGLAVRHGMLSAQGSYRFICDADLSMPIENVSRFLPPALQDFDVAIASREVPGAIRYNEPTYRHWIGRIFNTLVRIMAVPGFQDTQCGFKCFLDQAAIDLFSVQQLDGWTFDVEVLYIALKRGYRILEIPIPWYHIPGSRIRVLPDSMAMFMDLFTIRRNWRRGEYSRKQADAAVSDG
jgi:glycosyltransferase involved in cell wall biosynthesis